jgi:glycine/D-amino acid oxidase-like deaminating enzyme
LTAIATATAAGAAGAGTETCDVAIIGAGVEGLAAAWALARRQAGRIVVLERGTVGSGFTAKSSGILRCHYGVRSLAAMAWKSLEVLENAGTVLDADIGHRRAGYLVGVGPDNVAPLAANVAMQQTLGIDAGLIGATEVAAMLPAAHLDDFAAFAYEPHGGFADGYQTAAAFAGAARRLGVTIRQGAPVVALDPVPPGVQVTLTNGERLQAGTVVVAAGPWTGPLVAPFGIDLPLRTQREQLMVVAPGVDLPAPPVLSDLVSLQYVRLWQAGTDGRGTRLLVGNSDHHAPEWSDPDHYSDAPEDEPLVAAVGKFGHRFPSLADAGLESSYAGCYDVTPDYNPVIGPAPVAGVVLCTGFSGHGFKISPAVGELVADLVVKGASGDPDVPETDFRLERFAAGQPLVSPHPYAGAGEMR